MVNSTPSDTLLVKVTLPSPLPTFIGNFQRVVYLLKILEFSLTLVVLTLHLPPLTVLTLRFSDVIVLNTTSFPWSFPLALSLRNRWTSLVSFGHTVTSPLLVGGVSMTPSVESQGPFDVTLSPKVLLLKAPYGSPSSNFVSFSVSWFVFLFNSSLPRHCLRSRRGFFSRPRPHR